ncbi:C-CAP/cofactor C-like domain-containing protein [Mycena chlorophos]|uniref:C-CAP/cofactor C-like domain-containing protein n=1 Tax=Mycena chlorophos TaxID=658473 RepID=A0A8H6TIP1_MYCCL|nr:C-CAP/cofactor C-like domain-containing protein [Mycena chlorophos]
MAAESTWAFSQDFEVQFQTARTRSHLSRSSIFEIEIASELASRVDEAKKDAAKPDVLSALSLELANLAKLLSDATGSLPNYAQRQYESQVKELEKSLEELRALVPKSKFAFKRKTPTASTASTQSAPPTLPRPNAAEPARETSANMILSSHARRYLTHDALPLKASPTSDLTISDLNHCIVNLLGPELRISALHIRNLVDTVLLLPSIAGSVLLHDLRRCIVVVGCHQFRMHTSSVVDIYLSISSNPIIEHCSQLRFAKYPSTLASADLPSNLAVQDFSHIKPTPSPNWKMLEGAEVVWPIAVIDSEEAVEETLEALLPSCELA